MPDERQPTIAEEGGLPPNWIPIDVEPIVPSRPPQLSPDSSSSSIAPPVGSLPPSYQQNADFVRNAFRGQSTPNLSLMPLGVQGNASTNAGIQSTATQIVTQAINAIPPTSTADIESIASNVTNSAAYNVQLSDRDTLISLTNNSGGTVTLPGPTGSSFAFIQQGHTLALASDLATVTLTNGSKNLMFLIAWSGRSFTNTTFTVSDTNGNIWNQLYSVGDPGGTVQTAWYTEGIAAGVNTVTVLAVHGLGGIAETDVTIVEYSGIKPSGSLDAFSQGFNTSTNITTVTANDLVIFSAAGASGGGHAVLAPWTLRYDDGFQIVQDQIIVTPGTIVNCVGANSPEVTNGDPRSLAAFKPSIPLSAAGFIAGWYTYIQNIGTGTFQLQSNALIDNSGTSVTIGPNQGLLVVYDGTNWFTERGISFPNGTTGTGATVLANSPTLTGNIALSGKVTNYNGIVTVSDGIPAEYATVDLGTQSAAITATTLYAVPLLGQGMYRISWSAAITIVDGVSSTLGGTGGFQVLYTSSTDSIVKTTVAQADWTSTLNTTGIAVGGSVIVYAKASTNIQYQFGYTSNTPGQMVYEIHIKLEAL